MRVRWFGQSSFLLTGRDRSVFIDPFEDMSVLTARGLQFHYPAIDVDAELVLVTHEHGDHNPVDVVGGSPEVLRSRAGRHESPVGEVVAVASDEPIVALPAPPGA
jgi:hypothetical protein